MVGNGRGSITVAFGDAGDMDLDAALEVEVTMGSQYDGEHRLRSGGRSAW